MKIIQKINIHNDNRRELTEFTLKKFPKILETKLITVKKNGAILAKHYHKYKEIFLIAKGECVVKSWTKKYGFKKHKIKSPSMIMFDKKEEHVLICNKNTILIEYTPTVFNKNSNIPNTHLE